MRKAFRHTGVLMMVAVVALGLLGAAYTLWYENLSLTVQANTGTFNADMSFANWTAAGSYAADVNSGTGSGQPVVGVFGPAQNMSCSRSAFSAMTNHPNETSYQTNPNCNYIGYNNFNYQNWIFHSVNKLTSDFKCDVSIDTRGVNGTDANDTVDNNALFLTMSGLFPYAGCEYKFDIHNSGSVPLHLTKGANGIYKRCPLGAASTDSLCVNLSTSAPALSFATAGQDPQNSPAGPNDAICAALLGTPAGQLVTVGGVPVQVHPGQNVDCTFKVILDEAAGGENQTYYVSFGWTAHQWNEPDSIPNFPDQP